MMNNSNKKTMGRRKIEIKKIEKKSSLQVTFTKRRHGLFRKASELVILSGAQVGILVLSPAEKVYTFGHPTFEAMINHVEPSSAAFRPGQMQIIRHGDDGRSKYEEAMMMLEMEKRRSMANEGGFWWEQPFDGFELHELEEFWQALEGLRKNVEGRAEELEREFEQFAALSIQQVGDADSASSYLLHAQPFDQDQDTSTQQVCAANNSAASSYLLQAQPFEEQDQDQDISIQQVCANVDSAASSYLLQAQPFDQYQDEDISIQQVCADFSSSYLPFDQDQDQDIFDVLNRY